ncbi:MAG: hypothetical protein HQK79_06745 [Desulfobacterales bacterium]|nr:hypothetical protein [Desulfobacterales bacterium]MBF0396915.1 hypothetical protein [Desulfobacterales bacterium]
MEKRAFIFILAVSFCLGVINAYAGDDTDLFNELEKDAKPKEEVKEKKDAKPQGDGDLFNELETGSSPSTSKESSPKDDFADLEQSEKKPQLEQKPISKIVNQIPKNFEGNLRFKYLHYLRDPEKREGADLSNDFGNALLEYKSWTGGEIWKLNMSGWVEGGTDKGAYSGITHWMQDRDNRSRHIELNELYATISQKSYDVTFGKKTFTNGMCTLVSPSDRFRPGDGHDPIDPKEFGIWQARIDYYLKESTITGAILPVYTVPKTPHESSRWIGSVNRNGVIVAGDADFKDEDSEIIDEYPIIKASNVGYFSKIKTTYKGWDFGSSLYSGPNPYYVLQEEIRTEEKNGIKVQRKVRTKKTVRVNFISLGFSTTYKKWEFHGESLYNYSDHERDDDYITTVMGFTYTIDDWAKYLFMERIDATIEYSMESITNHQNADTYVKSSQQTRAGRNDLLARIKFKYNEDLNFEYDCNWDRVENGLFNHMEAEYRIKDGLMWKILGDVFSGPEKSTYGRWYKNDRIETTIEYKF